MKQQSLPRTLTTSTSVQVRAQQKPESQTTSPPSNKKSMRTRQNCPNLFGVCKTEASLTVSDGGQQVDVSPTVAARVGATSASLKKHSSQDQITPIYSTSDQKQCRLADIEGSIYLTRRRLVRLSIVHASSFQSSAQGDLAVSIG